MICGTKYDTSVCSETSPCDVMAVDAAHARIERTVCTRGMLAPSVGLVYKDAYITVPPPLFLIKLISILQWYCNGSSRTPQFNRTGIVDYRAFCGYIFRNYIVACSLLCILTIVRYATV